MKKKVSLVVICIVAVILLSSCALLGFKKNNCPAYSHTQIENNNS